MGTMFRRWMAYQPPKEQFGWTVLVILGPPLLLALLVLVSGGSGDVGTLELAILTLISVVGLTFVWVVPLVRHMVRPRS